MPPKVRITKEDIINAALETVRQNGADAINARSLASYLDCSTQPIFSNFDSMDELRLAVIDKATELYNNYLTREIDEQNYPAYKASGIAYIRFAREEKELFKLLFMRDRTNENYALPLDDFVANLVKNATGLSGDEASLFHSRMWACVHGIATMLATGYFELNWDIISKTITDTYQGARKQYGLE